MQFALNCCFISCPVRKPATRRSLLQLTTINRQQLGWLITVSLFLLVIQRQPVLAAATAPLTYPEFGAMATVGEALESCVSTAQLPTAKVLTPEQDWQAALQAGQAGDTFLLHGGVYQATALLVLPPGQPDRPLTIKPYNCEAVTLYAAVRPRSYNTLAGLHIETKNLLEERWVIRVDGKAYGHITGVIIRNNTIWGGTLDAVRVLDDTANVQITGNYIDGGGNGHTVFITAEDQQLLPDQIEVSNNVLTKAYYRSISEDMFQVRDVQHVTFTHNTCTNGYAMEQCVDIKSTRVSLEISHNLFDGDQLHLGGAGEDAAEGCMVIHEYDGDPQPHLIDHNFFRNCKGSVIRFAAASVDRGEISSAVVSDNLITAPNAGEGVIPVFQARNVEFNHNTLVNAYIKLGDAAHSRTPQNTTFRNNIIYQTAIDDHATAAGTAVACRHNLLFAVDGNNFDPNSCANSIMADPEFVEPAAGNFQLQPDSPAATAVGDDGRSLGAAIQEVPQPVAVPTPPPANNGKALSPQLYLPQLRN